jgi:hypothetical protein
MTSCSFQALVPDGGHDEHGEAGSIRRPVVAVAQRISSTSEPAQDCVLRFNDEARRQLRSIDIAAHRPHRTVETATIFGQELLKQRRSQRSRCTGLGAETHNPLDVGATVPTAVEKHNVATGRTPSRNAWLSESSAVLERSSVLVRQIRCGTSAREQVRLIAKS